MATIEPGIVIAERYQLDQELGRGGMGAVWRGTDRRLDTPIAVKVMHPDLIGEPALRARFEREAKAAAQIRSQHVVSAHDHGIHEDVPYFVMDLLDGEDLSERLGRVGAMDPSEVERIATEICHGLHRAHQLDIVHRDLKPSNVFLSAPDNDAVKLLDFGIARASGIKPVGAETTKSGELIGSPHYMSPEQVRGAGLDGRTDLWALAVILYRLLTGRRPYPGKDLGELIIRIATEPAPPVSQYRPELGPSFDAFFHKAFSRDIDGRFPTARAFADAFRAAVRGDESFSSLAAAGSGSSWETAEQVAPPSAPTRAVGDGVDSGPHPTHTPIGASRTIPGLRRSSRTWRWGMVGGVGLAGIVAAVLLMTRGAEDGDRAAPAASTDTSATVSAGGGGQPSSSPADAGEEASETPSASAAVEPAVDASAVPDTSAGTPRPGPRPTGAGTSTRRPPATTAPPATATRPGMLDDLGTGGRRLGYE